MKRVIRCPTRIFEHAKKYYNGYDIESLEPNGYGRRHLIQQPFDDDVKKEVFSLFGFDEIYDEPVLENFIGNNYLPGAFVHPHTDPTVPGFTHIRCNIAVEMPELGGNPVLMGKEVVVGTGDIWVCFASKEVHTSKPLIKGQRKVISLGALIKNEVADSLFSLLHKTKHFVDYK